MLPSKCINVALKIMLKTFINPKFFSWNVHEREQLQLYKLQSTFSEL